MTKSERNKVEVATDGMHENLVGPTRPTKPDNQQSGIHNNTKADGLGVLTVHSFINVSAFLLHHFKEFLFS
jgi:hypothetical protein